MNNEINEKREEKVYTSIITSTVKLADPNRKLSDYKHGEVISSFRVELKILWVKNP